VGSLEYSVAYVVLVLSKICRAIQKCFITIHASVYSIDIFAFHARVRGPTLDRLFVIKKKKKIASDVLD